MSGLVPDALARPEPDHGESFQAVTLKISAGASDLLSAAGGLIVEVRERSPGLFIQGDAGPSTPVGCSEDPLIDFLRSHPLAHASASDVTASTLLQCDALERFEVPNGSKAIGIWMFRRWTREIAEHHGPARPAATLRRWRAIHPRWGDG